MPEPNFNKSLLNSASGPSWQKIGLQKRAGALVPLFSVYSKRSAGIGDLGDLKLIADWCNKTGNSILQLLPMNEASPIRCPYDSISSFALDPVYIALDQVLPRPEKHIQDEIEGIKRKFPAGRPFVDYGIKQEKINLLWDIHTLYKQDNTAELDEFRGENGYWIEDFALFKVLKDSQGGRAWYEWEEDYRRRDPDRLGDFRQKHEAQIEFQVWIQWQLYKQFKEGKDYAKGKKVLLKGDLPILVSRDSADVWAHPELFKLEFAAGAPPDMYCAKGQRWGMPTHNWDNIASQGYKYIKEKLKYNQNFYDILRIDHVVGLFRIWSVPYNEPLENKGLNGIFDPADENQWGKHGRDILSVMVSNSNMLLCAEDLGIIPQSCPETLSSLGVPGNDVQRWTKDWKVSHDFLPPCRYRPLCVAMLSTHDTTNWPAWWKYEAGTVDEAFFIRKCAEKNIDYLQLKNRLFNPASSYGRLRWLESVDSVERLLNVLGLSREGAGDLIGMYQDTYQEKEKLWKHLNIEGPLREEPDREILVSCLKMNLDSQAIFCIETILDWLFLAGIFKGEPSRYRINTPGTINLNNWSLVIPLPLEELLKHKVCRDIKKLIISSGRL